MSEEGAFVTEDPTQRWIAVKGSQEEIVIDTKDTSKCIFSNYIEQLLYSKKRNRLYIFSYSKGTTVISEINAQTCEEIFSKTLPRSISMDSKAFFSSDENKIYIPEEADNPTSVTKILCFSTRSNRITSSFFLNTLGVKNADVYSIYAGQRGKCIIESYLEQTPGGVYYQVCNMDSLTHAEPIFVRGNSKPFLLGGGKYLLISHEYTDTIKYGYARDLNSGAFSIYDSKDMRLIKDFNLSPGFDICTYVNFPNTIFCTSGRDENLQAIKVEVNALLEENLFIH
jgi:hypothetical protein